MTEYELKIIGEKITALRDDLSAYGATGLSAELVDGEARYAGLVACIHRDDLPDEVLAELRELTADGRNTVNNRLFLTFNVIKVIEAAENVCLYYEKCLTKNR